LANLSLFSFDSPEISCGFHNREQNSMKRNFGSDSFAKSLLLRNLAVNIRRLSKERGFTLNETAEKADVSSRYITELVASKANITLLLVENIANKLQVDPYELLKEYPADQERPIFGTKKVSEGPGGPDTGAPNDLLRSQQMLNMSMVALFERIGSATSEWSSISQQLRRVAEQLENAQQKMI
jgi:transcriptional regulator with XRE-family HTH domain